VADLDDAHLVGAIRGTRAPPPRRRKSGKLRHHIADGQASVGENSSSLNSGDKSV
jgi:hypothetical protein